ncbi:MAG: hypothetical protein NC123_15500 [Butyrivibrio sp.]|nr:hypothetical protein [Acetatifactor muris]MCM1560925.1 hypothetical protein [Butyrivibrio sp.]
MEQFTMTLSKDFQRPIIYLSSWHGLNALLDTGALFPVWTAPETILPSLGGILVRKNVVFGGFGGKTYGNLYQLRKVTIGKLIFPEMSVISCNAFENVPYHILLSATMFQHLIYEIDDENHKFNVTIPDGESCIRNLKIQDKSGKLYVLCNSVSNENL